MALSFKNCIICNVENHEREYETTADLINANVCVACLERYGDKVGDMRRAAVTQRINHPANDWLPQIPLTQVGPPYSFLKKGWNEGNELSTDFLNVGEDELRGFLNVDTELFHETVEHPVEELLDGPQQGVFYDYVVSDYLDAIVNRTEPKLAFMFVRYESSGHNEAISTILNGPGWAKLGRHDDVALIRTSHDGSRLWLFCFDNDSSDCAFGWVENTGSNLSAMLKWIRERATVIFAEDQPNTPVPEGGVLLEIPNLTKPVQW